MYVLAHTKTAWLSFHTENNKNTYQNIKKHKKVKAKKHAQSSECKLLIQMLRIYSSKTKRNG